MASKYGGVTIPLEETVSKAREELEAKEESRNYIGASVIGKECARELWYGFRHAKKVGFPGRIYRRFDLGHWAEERLIQDLQIAGYEVQHINPSAKGSKDQFRAALLGGLVSGGVDGFIRGNELGDVWHLLEVKAMVSSKYERDEETGEPVANKVTDDKKKAQGRYWKTAGQGVKRAQPTHYAQMQLYMALSHAQDIWKPEFKVHATWGLEAPLTRGLYVIVNSDTSQLHAEVIEYDRDAAVELYQKARAIITATTPPERIANGAKYPPCSWCDMKDVCHYGEPMAIDCRTCENMELKLPGERGNYGRIPLFLCTKHKRSCGKFEACDAYQPINQEETF